VLSIPHESFAQAKAQNLNVLSVVSAEGSRLVYLLAPFIAIVGMTKSFLGVGLSVTETFAQLITEASGLKGAGGKRAAYLIMFALTFGIVYANPNVITLIETFCGPLIAIILFLIPAWLIYTRTELRELRGVKTAIIAIAGVATLSALLYSMV